MSTKKPKKLPVSKIVVRSTAITPRVTVNDMAVNLYYSMMYLELENENMLPTTMLDDAYEMTVMMLEADKIDYDERLVDNIVYHYLKIRQQQMNKIIAPMFKKDSE
jgi:hypothetical protein